MNMMISYQELVRTFPNIEHTILSYISKYSPEWDNYISAVRQEIIVRAAELE